MARMRDLTVGMQIEIVRGKESPESFLHPDAEKYVGSIGNVAILDAEDDTKRNVCIDGIFWYPASWIKIVENVKPEMIAIFEGETSPEFVDINRLFSIAEEYFGMDTPEKVKANLEKGRLQIFKLVPVKVGIVIHEPEIKIM